MTDDFPKIQDRLKSGYRIYVVEHFGDMPLGFGVGYDFIADPDSGSNVPAELNSFRIHGEK